MNQDTKDKIINLLSSGVNLQTRAELESKYPLRNMSDGAEAVRFAPSPTGFVHIGAVFTALICQYTAKQTGGVYFLRIEDTDKKREVEGSRQMIVEQLAAFGVSPDEGLQVDGSFAGDYGPYVQSERRGIYLAFAVDMINRGRAYPCFATSDELQAAVKDQQQKKLRPGYYGQWALWRDRSDADVNEALDQGKPFVLRFKSTGSHTSRMEFDDVIKGHMNVPENDLDVPLIKSDEYRLPTYHLAHVVDDYLMRTTTVFRGEEWLPSTPLHIELCQALDITPFKYAHTPVISIVDPSGGGKRKLSKRKDPEADVGFWLKQAYPLKSIKAYLLGLANSNFEDWYKENPDAPLEDFEFSLKKLASSRSPLLDMKKLEDYAKDEIARLSQEDFNSEVLSWTEVHDKELFSELTADAAYTNSVLSIERDGEKPRKDVSKWADAPDQFGYYYDNLFASRFTEAAAEALEGVSADNITAARSAFLDKYSHAADKETWFANMKLAAEAAGYCLDRKELKANPDNYKGGISDFAKIIRVAMTGKTRTPDLYTIMQVMGEPRTLRRLR